MKQKLSWTEHADVIRNILSLLENIEAIGYQQHKIYLLEKCLIDFRGHGPCGFILTDKLYGKAYVDVFPEDVPEETKMVLALQYTVGNRNPHTKFEHAILQVMRDHLKMIYRGLNANSLVITKDNLAYSKYTDYYHGMSDKESNYECINF